MITVKLDSKVGKAAGITPAEAADAYNRLGSTRLAVVELTSVERTEPYADDEKDPSVKLRITAMELPRGDVDEKDTRELLERIFEARTGMLRLDSRAGVLDGQGDD